MRGSHAVSFMTELEEVSMGIVVALDVHRKQITYKALDRDTGEVRRGRIAPAARADVRRAALLQSPLTDSNRRPPLYEEGPCVKWVVFVHRPVRAGVRVGVLEQRSSLYRLLVGRTWPMGVRSGGASP